MKREWRVRGKMLVQAFEPFTMESVFAASEEEAMARATSAGLIEIEWAREIPSESAGRAFPQLLRVPGSAPRPETT